MQSILIEIFDDIGHYIDEQFVKLNHKHKGAVHGQLFDYFSKRCTYCHHRFEFKDGDKKKLENLEVKNDLICAYCALSKKDCREGYIILEKPSSLYFEDVFPDGFVQMLYVQNEIECARVYAYSIWSKELSPILSRWPKEQKNNTERI